MSYTQNEAAALIGNRVRANQSFRGIAYGTFGTVTGFDESENGYILIIEFEYKKYPWSGTGRHPHKICKKDYRRCLSI